MRRTEREKGNLIENEITEGEIEEIKKEKEKADLL